MLLSATCNRTEFAEAARLVARECFGWKGVFIYQAFDYVNRTFFEEALPCPLILWQITPHGKCLGFTESTVDQAPVIRLHPSTLGGTETLNPWGIPAKCLGLRYAVDVLLHECIHVAASCLLGYVNGIGQSSHNNPIWVGEVNRIAKLLGFTGIEAEGTTVKRIPIDGELTKRGKQPTKSARVAAGNVPYAQCVASFPHGLRRYLGQEDYYLSRSVPFDLSLLGQDD